MLLFWKYFCNCFSLVGFYFRTVHESIQTVKCWNCWILYMEQPHDFWRSITATVPLIFFETLCLLRCGHFPGGANLVSKRKFLSQACQGHRGAVAYPSWRCIWRSRPRSGRLPTHFGNQCDPAALVPCLVLRQSFKLQSPASPAPVIQHRHGH